MTANCASIFGSQSTLAPTSTTTTLRACQRGKNGSQRRPVHTGHDTLHHLRGGHNGAGVAGRNEAMRESVANQPGADANGRILFGADCFCGAILHRDLLAGVMDHDSGAVPAGVILVQFAHARHLPGRRE